MAEGKQTENENQNAETSDVKTAVAGDDVVQKKEEKDLETLLDEYGKDSDSKTNRTDDKNEEDDDDFVNLSKEEVRELRADKIERANTRVTSDVKAAVKIARGESDLPEEADTLIEGLLHQAVANDPKMKAAWEGRAKNPKGWNQILVKQSEKFGALIDKIVESRSGSNSALESAVHSSKTSKPLNNALPGLGAMTKMSDAEFAKLTRG